MLLVDEIQCQLPEELLSDVDRINTLVRDTNSKPICCGTIALPIMFAAQRSVQVKP